MFYNKYNFIIKDFTASDYSRPEITGVLVSPKKTIATDSFMLLEVDSVKADPKDFPVIPDKPKMRVDFKPFILPKEKAGDVIKLFGKDNDSLPIINNAIVIRSNKMEVDNRAEIGKTDLESYNSVMSRVIEGDFPDTKDLMKESGEYAEIEVNPALLKKIAGFFDSFRSSKTDSIKIRVPIDAQSPIFFKGKRDSTEQTATALLMPIKKS